MASTVVVNRRDEEFDIYVGRPSKWGNPYIIGRDGTRLQVIEKYRQHIQSSRLLMMCIPELVGKKLGCWCKPLPCHGDILVDLAEKYRSI